ncbi:MAG TPA: 4Fe-4S dicluster domain-containing protein [Bacillota bacterium]|jgi:ferredoxin like protein
MGEDLCTTPAAKTTRDSFNPPPEPSLWLKDPALCGDAECARPCLTVCPAGVFEWRGGPASADEVRSKALAQMGRLITIHYQRCLECGACLYLCPRGNIHFNYPAGGYGVYYIRS